MLPESRFLTAGFAVATAQHIFAAAAARARNLSLHDLIQMGSREKTIMKPKSKDTVRRSPAVAFAAIMLSLWPFAASAGDHECTSAGPAYRITLPGDWIAANNGGIVSYRSPSRLEAVTVAVYGMTAPLTDAGRTELMEKSAEMRRGLERELSGGHLVLSEVTRARVGGLLQMRYSGENTRANKKFAALMAASPHCMVSVYYEAIGSSQGAFERTAHDLFGRLEILGVRGPQTVLDSPAQALERGPGEAPVLAVGRDTPPVSRPPLLPTLPIGLSPP